MMLERILIVGLASAAIMLILGLFGKLRRRRIAFRGPSILMAHQLLLIYVLVGAWSWSASIVAFGFVVFLFSMLRLIWNQTRSGPIPLTFNVVRLIASQPAASLRLIATTAIARVVVLGGEVFMLLFYVRDRPAGSQLEYSFAVAGGASLLLAIPGCLISSRMMRQPLIDDDTRSGVLFSFWSSMLIIYASCVGMVISRQPGATPYLRGVRLYPNIVFGLAAGGVVLAIIAFVGFLAGSRRRRDDIIRGARFRRDRATNQRGLLRDARSHTQVRVGLMRELRSVEDEYDRTILQLAMPDAWLRAIPDAWLHIPVLGTILESSSATGHSSPENLFSGDNPFSYAPPWQDPWSADGGSHSCGDSIDRMATPEPADDRKTNVEQHDDAQHDDAQQDDAQQDDAQQDDAQQDDAQQDDAQQDDAQQDDGPRGPLRRRWDEARAVLDVPVATGLADVLMFEKGSGDWYVLASLWHACNNEWVPRNQWMARIDDLREVGTQYLSDLAVCRSATEAFMPLSFELYRLTRCVRWAIRRALGIVDVWINIQTKILSLYLAYLDEIPERDPGFVHVMWLSKNRQILGDLLATTESGRADDAELQSMREDLKEDRDSAEVIESRALTTRPPISRALLSLCVPFVATTVSPLLQKLAHTR